MNTEIAVMSLADHAEMAELWKRSEGVSYHEASDSPEAVERFLVRNPGMSFVARSDGRLVGAVLGGHDGRRGYLYHLAVAAEAKRSGIGRMLVERCVATMQDVGIRRCNILVYASNAAGLAFWQALGWKLHPDVAYLGRNFA